MKPLAYLLESDMGFDEGWELGEVAYRSDEKSVPPHLFRQGVPFEVAQGLVVPASRTGRETQFTMAPFEVPVVGSRIAALLERNEAELVPVDVSRPVGERYFILNTLRETDAIDATKSRITRWKASDGRPDKTGSIRMITRLVLSAEAVCCAPQIFRLSGWAIPLVVRSELAERLREFEGLDLIPVETS